MQRILQIFSNTIFLGFLLTGGLCNAKQIDQGYVNSSGVKIYYQDSGAGEQTIVLLHGYAMDHSMWLESGIFESLSNNNRVLALDLRGHGKSGKPAAPGDYGPKVGLDIVSLLDKLKIDKAHLVGFSMGAYVASRLLVTHPHRISSAVLCSGGFPVQSEQEKEFQLATAEHMKEDGNLALANVALGWEFDGVTKEQIKNIKVPILSVFGSKEINHGTKDQIQLLELPESAQTTIVIEGADHDSQHAAVLHPEFLLAVQKFVSAN